jgi:hypothetical protein
MECRRVRDLPTGPALLALARDALLRQLMPLLPQEAHLEARLVANSMAIAEREAVAGEEHAQEILRQLEKLYGESGSGELGLLARLAHDLRLGVLESSEPREHHAREILWRLTIAKLRSANPRFLNANGFS